MLDRVYPFKAIDDPFLYCGNPRFCTQYNNSETLENVGPMLSGTASWLSLTVSEFLGISYSGDKMTVSPILPFDAEKSSFELNRGGTKYSVTVEKKKGFAVRPPRPSTISTASAAALYSTLRRTRDITRCESYSDLPPHSVRHCLRSGVSAHEKSVCRSSKKCVTVRKMCAEILTNERERSILYIEESAREVRLSRSRSEITDGTYNRTVFGAG